MRLLVQAAALVLGAAPAAAQLPSSLDRAAIDQCAPSSMDSATDCLQRALSSEDAAALARPEGAHERAELNRLLYDSWNLADPATALASDLRRLDLYYPGLAPSFIVMNLLRRREGHPPDWRAVASEVRRQPLLMQLANEPPYVPPSSTAGGTLLSADECAAAARGRYTHVEACYRMPDGRLIVRTAQRVDGGSDAD
jgi:hypothetical protein